MLRRSLPLVLFIIFNIPAQAWQIDGFFETTDRAKLYYQVKSDLPQGEGYPLMLLHGGEYTTEGRCKGLTSWDPQIDVFARYYTVVRLDMRYCGRSSDTGQNPLYSWGWSSTPQRVTLDVVELMEKLHKSGVISNQGHILGLSIGSAIAAQLAVFYPEKVSRLILASPWEYRTLPRNSVSQLQALKDITDKTMLLGADYQYLNELAWAQSQSYDPLHFFIAYAGHFVNRDQPKQFNQRVLEFLRNLHLLAGLTSAGQIYFTFNLSNFVNLPGQLAQLQVGHFNGDGQPDLAGLASNGSIWYTFLGAWTQIPGNLAQLQVYDLNGDAQTDLVGLASNGSIWYTTNLSTWTQIPGNLAQLRVGDLNGDGHTELAGLASNGSIWYTTDIRTWTPVPGVLAQLRVGDLNGDGQADLAGLASNGSIWYTTDLRTWTPVPGVLAQLRVGDLNGDGQADLVGLASNGSIWYTTDLHAWTQIPGNLNQLRVDDLNGDGQADLVGLASNDSIWYTTDLRAWTQIPGQLRRLAGDD